MARETLLRIMTVTGLTHLLQLPVFPSPVQASLELQMEQLEAVFLLLELLLTRFVFSFQSLLCFLGTEGTSETHYAVISN